MVRMARSSGASVAPRGGDLLPPHRRRPSRRPGRNSEPALLAFYGELVERVELVARLAAEWMAAGFTHGVLNTDNMSLVGESFDYGPFAFLEGWDPGFTAAYFDAVALAAMDPERPDPVPLTLQLLAAWPVAYGEFFAALADRLKRIWAAIDERDDWQPLHDWLDRCGSSHSAGSGCSALQLPPQDSV